MMTRDAAITTVQPMYLRCDVCSHRIETEAEVDVSFLMTPQPTVLSLHLRLIGTSLPDDAKLLSVLEYLHGVLTRAHGTGSQQLPMMSEDFRNKVLDVNGALQLLLSAGWTMDEGDFTMCFSRPRSEPCQRQLLCMELLQSELDGLKGPQPRRRHTLPLEAELPFVVEEYNVLVRLWESRDMVPSVSMLQRWTYLWAYFRLMCAYKPGGLYEHHLLQARTYSLHMTDRVRNVYHSLLLPPIALSESHGVLSDGTPNSTPVKPNTLDASLTMGASPPMYTSPGEALVRTPMYGQEREEFRIAQPAAHLLSRDPSTTHAGLLNMRQCCFMNSLLQAYFLFHPMAAAIVGVPCLKECELAHRTDTNVKLLHRLQSLFAYMEMSRISCINPKYVLEAVATLHPTFRDGGQHDPQEFASCVVEMVVSAMQRVSPHNISAVNRMLYGECVERSVQWDGKMSEERRTPVVHSLPLYFDSAAQVVATAPSHRDPMNPSMSTAASGGVTYSLDTALLDYVVEMKDADCTIQTVCKAFASLPSLLMLHFPSRVVLTGTKKQDVAITYSETLDMTPYSTAPECVAKRDEYIALTAKERSLTREILRAKQCLEQLESVVKSYGDLQSPEHAFMMTCVLRGQKEKVRALEADIAAVAARRKSFVPFCAEKPNPKLQYRLHAVLVHLGSSSDFGHYISYVRDTGTQRWLRCDDTAVRHVDQSEVFSTYAQQNVYCLLYTTDATPRTPLDIPEYLQDIIQHEDLRKHERIARRLSMYVGDLEDNGPDALDSSNFLAKV